MNDKQKPPSKSESHSQKKTKKLALSAILSAVGVVCLTLGSIIEPLDLTSAVLAGFVVVLAVIEIGSYYPYMIYFVTSVLALIIVPNKLPALIFLCFCGLYPIFKAYIERFHNLVAWVVKISMFNTFFTISIIAIKYLFNIIDPIFSFEFLVFVVANIAFLLYDISMTQLITLYLIKIRKLLGLKNYFE